MSKGTRDIKNDYITRDFRGYRELMIENIPKIIPEWTDRGDSDLGIAIIDTLAYGLDVLTYYQEKSLRESMISTAETRFGVHNGAMFLGYSPKRQTPAKAKLTVVKKEDYIDTDCHIPYLKGKFSTDSKYGDVVHFEAMETVLIPAGEREAVVEVEQGISTVGESLGISNGLPYQQFTIQNPDVILKDLTLLVSKDGFTDEWREVDTLLYSKGDSPHFITRLDEEDRTIIEFGDGILGMIPEEDSEITVSYRYGGGEIGNLAPRIINTVSDLSEFDMEFIEDVYNEEASHGGADYESLDIIKNRAPKQYRIHNRIVSSLDAKDYAEMQEGVIKAFPVETFKNDFFLHLHLDPVYRGNSKELFKNLKEKMDEIRVKNVRLILKEAKVKEIPVGVTVYVSKNVDVDRVKSEVTEEIRSYFPKNYFEFKKPFFSTRVLDLAYNIPEVRNATLKEGTNDVFPIISEDEVEILEIGDIDVEVIVYEAL